MLSSSRQALRLLDGPLSSLSDAIRRSRYDQLTTLLVGTIAGWEWQRHRNEPALPLHVLQAELVATTVALLTAPAAVVAAPAPAHARAPAHAP